MTDHYLLGSETVQSAACQMERAAQNMRGAASEFDSAVGQLRNFMDDWLQRFDYTFKNASRDARREDILAEFRSFYERNMKAEYPGYKPEMERKKT